MYKILEKQRLNSQVCRIRIAAPEIAKRVKAGQFVILRIDNRGERIPLTIFEKDSKAGIITIIFQEIGKTTYKLGTMKAGEAILDLIGPLGVPTHIEKLGHVVYIGGGVGTAEIYPGACALKAAGNEVTAIIGARTKELVILEDELKTTADRVFVTTDDGSYQRKGFVTSVLGELLEKEKFDKVFAVGPNPMMKAVCHVTKPYGISTMVSLSANMVDGTGMCGTCRVTVGGEIKFTCVDGPEFDGHLVDFDELMKRDKRFEAQEKKALELFKSECEGKCQKHQSQNKIQKNA